MDLVHNNENIEAEVKQNYRHNFLVNALDGASFWFGMSFISSTIILPIYVSHFTSNPILIGLIPVLSTAGYLLPQLFTANVIERAPRKKVFVVNLGFFTERLPILLLAPSAYFLAVNQPAAALAAFFALYAWHTFGAGLVIVSWQDMIAKVIPVTRRGLFFGLTNFIGNGTGIIGALVVTWVIRRFPFPNGYVFSFFVASILILLSWVFLALTREPAVHTSKPRVSQTAYFRSLPEVLRRDLNFSKYLLAQILSYLSGMAGTFLIIYLIQEWSLTDAQAAGYTIAMQVGIALGNIFFGLLADRMGHKLSLEICYLISAASLFLAVIARQPWLFYLVFLLRGALNGGTFVSGISIVYEFTSAESRPTYLGLANTLPGVVGFIAPLIAGWLSSRYNYPAMFVLAAVFGLASWAVLRYAVAEPRKKNKPISEITVS